MLKNPTTKERVSLLPSWGYCHAAYDQALKRLVRAVIIQAGHDARGDDFEAFQARQWLTSEDGAYFCECGGVNFKAVQEWVNAGCPKLTNTRGLK